MSNVYTFLDISLETPADRVEEASLRWLNGRPSRAALFGGIGGPLVFYAGRRLGVGDGWLQAGRDDFEPLIARLTALRKEYGREREPFEIHVISWEGYSVDGVHRLEDLGVTDLIVGLRYVYDRSTDSMTLSEKIDALRTYADNVISNV